MPPKFLAMPVQAQIAYHGTQPGWKACRAIGPKTPQPMEPFSAELLTDKKKAIGDMVGVLLEMPDDLEKQRGVRVQEFSPGLLRMARTKLVQDPSDRSLLHKALLLGEPLYSLESVKGQRERQDTGRQCSRRPRTMPALVLQAPCGENSERQRPGE